MFPPSHAANLPPFLDWLRIEYGIERPSNKLLALTIRDPSTWVSEVKRIHGKNQPLSSAGLHALRDEYIRTPSGKAEGRMKSAESGGRIPLMWQTAPPRVSIPRRGA